MGLEMPPCLEHVVIYFMQKGMDKEDAEYFFQYQQLRYWKTEHGTKIRNWKTVACDWIWDKNHPIPDTTRNLY